MADFWTLGPLVRQWIEQHCVIPDGPRMGDPFILTKEMAGFVDAFYALDVETKQWVYVRGGQFIRPQKYGKGPFSAALICAEAAGPVLPVWDDNKLVGARAWDTPWIQVTAVSEDQTDNVFRALLPMIQLSDRLNMEIADTGLTRINLPGGGYIEPVTASARSRLGQRLTFAVQDETHSWFETNGGWKLADNQRRNLAGMGGRFMETTNAFDPVENSVAQRTYESKAPGVLIDDADPPPGSVRNKRERRQVMKAVYGDSLLERGGWVDLDRIDAEVEALLEHDPQQAERFFLNRKQASEGAAFDFEKWREQAAPYPVVPPRGSMIVIGVDGARHDDALAVVACDIKTGYLWPLGIWERPDHATDDYVHPQDEVDGIIRDAFARWMVWRLYADPQHIKSLLEGWANDYGSKRIIEWPTYRPRPIAWAIRNFTQAISTGDVTHSGDKTLTEHIRNSRKKRLTVQDDKEQFMHTLAKPAIQSPLKIDGAMAAVLAWEARGDALAARIVTTKEFQPPEEAQGPAPWQPGTALAANQMTHQPEHGPMGALS